MKYRRGTRVRCRAAAAGGKLEDFGWCGSKLQIARQIGNAVPVELVTGLAAHLP